MWWWDGAHRCKPRRCLLPLLTHTHTHTHTHTNPLPAALLPRIPRHARLRAPRVGITDYARYLRVGARAPLCICLLPNCVVRLGRPCVAQGTWGSSAAGYHGAHLPHAGHCCEPQRGPGRRGGRCTTPFDVLHGHAHTCSIQHTDSTLLTYCTDTHTCSLRYTQHKHPNSPAHTHTHTHAHPRISHSPRGGTPTSPPPVTSLSPMPSPT